MKPKIVVIGGTGLIGSKVVEKLKQKGNDAVAASPDTAVYTMNSEGSDGALAGAEVVVGVANSPSFEDPAAWDFFQVVGENLAAAEVADAINFFRTAHENLAAAELAAGVKHHVALSVVGTERLQDLAYFRRSEEHTSELQSQSNLVCRLLLEKKNIHDPVEAVTNEAPLPLIAVGPAPRPRIEAERARPTAGRGLAPDAADVLDSRSQPDTIPS